MSDSSTPPPATTPDLSGWDTDHLATLAATILGSAYNATIDLTVVGSELLSRLVVPQPVLDLDTIVAWIKDEARTEADLIALNIAIDEVPEIPVDPDPDPPVDPEPEPVDPDPLDFASASDRYSASWPTHTVVAIDASMTKMEILNAVRGSDSGGTVKPGTVVMVSGVIEGLWIGGGHAYAISNADGSPLGDLCLDFMPGARVDGFKIGDSKGGIEGELRLVNPVLRADDMDVTVKPLPDGTYGVVKTDLDAEPVIIDSDEAMHNGETMGDFAPLRLLNHMPGLHLVAIATSIEVDDRWKSYDGMGIKWAVLLKTCRATFDGFIADPAREHSFYYHNTVDLFAEGATNRTRLLTDAAGDTRVLGNGRTFEQHANRVPQDFPKGGAASTGSVVWKDCEAVRCGWEGQLAWIDSHGVVHPGNPIAGGGSDFTCHGHTGNVYALIDCRSTKPYAGSVACWNEAVAQSKTDANPEGHRAWMLTPTGHIYNPIEDGDLHGWGTTRFVVSGFTVMGERAPQQRRPFLISGALRVELDGLSVNGFDDMDDLLNDIYPIVVLNHQEGATPIGTLVVDGEVVS